MLKISFMAKRLLISALLLLASQYSYALSGENMAYMGILSNGKIINAQYQTTPSDMNNWTWLFGDKKHNNFKTCWVTKNNRIRNFKCASKHNGEIIVQYKTLSKHNKQHSKAMKIYKKKLDRCERGIDHVFICEAGCNSNTPKYIYEIGIDGLGCSDGSL